MAKGLVRFIKAVVKSKGFQITQLVASHVRGVENLVVEVANGTIMTVHLTIDTVDHIVTRFVIHQKGFINGDGIQHLCHQITAIGQYDIKSLQDGSGLLWSEVMILD